MATNRQHIQHYIRDFNFKKLFVNELGWDNLHEQALAVSFENQAFLLHPLVEKRGFKVYLCNPNAQGKIPPDSVLRKIEREVTRYAYEHLIIYVDAARDKQVWQWVKREQGARSAPRLNRYQKGQSGELLAQKLEKLAIALDEEDKLHMADVVGRVARAFDVERVTRKFYDRFKLEHAFFLNLISGIEARADREWYASLMLNRLMFIYFIQRKGFLDTHVAGRLDGDPNYLTNRLKRVQQERGENEFHTFYRYFLLKLFHDGLSKREHSPALEKLLGKVPYLNGGLFDLHVLERDNPDINIPDEAFEKLFSFFDDFDWHLDDRPLRNDKEINPDVLGYIFEKYINQRQMGAYYTKEDITGYISKNTILPYIFDEDEVASIATITDLYNEKAGILDGEPDSEVDLASQAYQIWKNATDANPKLKGIIERLPNVIFSTRAHQSTAAAPEGVLLYMRTSEGNDALAWVNRKGENVTQSQLAILRAAACDINTKAIERPPEQHDLVKQGVEHIIEEETRNVGGQLGAPSGARRRTYERLKLYIDKTRDTLFPPPPELFSAVDEIYRYPLQEMARDALNRQLRSGIDDEQLVNLVINLRADNHLCQVHEQEEPGEPQIICSLGLFEGNG